MTERMRFGAAAKAVTFYLDFALWDLTGVIDRAEHRAEHRAQRFLAVRYPKVAAYFGVQAVWLERGGADWSAFAIASAAACRNCVRH